MTVASPPNPSPASPKPEINIGFRTPPLPAPDVRDAVITDHRGRVVWKMADFSAPAMWSDKARAIVASKYALRAKVPSRTVDAPGSEGLPAELRPQIPAHDATFGSETSAYQIVRRIAGALAHGALTLGYLTAPKARDFFYNMQAILLMQYAFPNSPQFFNTGLWWAYGIEGNPNGYAADHLTGEVCACLNAYRRPNVSACFIEALIDALVGKQSISALWDTESRIFKFGSGSGVDLSPLRGKGEPLSLGGTSSGVISFAKVGDANAGAIKSGGQSRRAALMRIMQIDHPDIEEFIGWKGGEEDKVAMLVTGSRLLRHHLLPIYEGRRRGDDIQALTQEAERAGVPWSLMRRAIMLADQGLPFDVREMNTDWEGEAYQTVSGQNANNSIRIPDAFMHALARGDMWHLRRRTDGGIAKTLPAAELWAKLNQQAWACADPGVQFDDTIQRWHTCPNDGKINATNPCVTGDTLVLCVGEDGGACERRIDQMLDGPQTIIVDQGERRIGPAFHTGRKPTLKITYSDAYRPATRAELGEEPDGNIRSLTLTHDHLVSAWRSGARVDVAAQDLKVGDILHGEEGPAYASVLYRWTVLSIEEGGEHDVYDLTEPQTHHFIANGIRVHNCSEYCFLDDTACNLASIRLTRFQDEDGFDADSFIHVCEVMTLALEVSVAIASYPTERIARRSWEYRTLGLGFADLGALLMIRGLGYDSDEGRATAHTITALMTGTAYNVSRMIAARMGSFDRYEANCEPMQAVLRAHQDALALTAKRGDMRHAAKLARAAWDAVTHDPTCGFRNAQVTVIAPTGTIALGLDCETTGCEPEFALVRYKTLAGGGTMTLVNGLVPRALEALGWDKEQIERAVAHIKVHGDLAGFSGLAGLNPSADEVMLKLAMDVLRCANPARPGGDHLSPQAHIEMMAAIQPLISGAISKTVNLPATATVADVAMIHKIAWGLGLKAVAIYVDGSKHSQPLNLAPAKTDSAPATPSAPTATPSAESAPPRVESQPTPAHNVAPVPMRRKPADNLKGERWGFDLGGHRFYLHSGEDEAGQLVEVFLRASNTGSAMSGLLDTVGRLVSALLQYGVPAEKVLAILHDARFTPDGMIRADFLQGRARFAASPLDAVAQILQAHYFPDDAATPSDPHAPLDTPQPAPVAAVTPKPAMAQPAAKRHSGEACGTCGNFTLKKSGSCFVCESCGTTTGCS